MDGADKPSIRDWLKIKTAPDVLDTIANLSNDEVFTSPGLANQMLDLLPAHVWSDPTLKFLDPCCKTGVFLREIVKRLMSGLITVFPDEQARREHILRNQVYGIAITELTALMSRRTVYCASDATRLPNPDYPENCFSAVVFDTPEGNIKFPQVEHDIGKDGKCTICGANSDTSIGEDGRESYAYPFIHMDIREIFGDMQFDVIVGNPPYQIATGGHGAQAKPIYHKFVNMAESLSAKYITMIIPARWYAGGMGLDEFREKMMKEGGLKTIVDIPNSAECFPGVEIKGGVCYFLKEHDYKGRCEFVNIKNNQIESFEIRDISEFDIIVRNNKAISILKKISLKSDKFMNEIVSSVNPFGIPTNEKGVKEKGDNFVKLFANKTVSWIHPSKINDRNKIIGKYKILSSKGYGAGEGYPHQIIGKPIIAGPDSVCSMTYICVADFDKYEESVNFSKYYKTKFFRFMVGIRKNTQDVTRDRFTFVPIMDMSKVWTDDDLYEHFKLSKSEISFIEESIREME